MTIQRTIPHMYTKALATGLLLLGAGAGAGAACGQAYPVKPIRVLTSQPGSGFDFASRLIADPLSASFGQPLIVDNRGGAGGIYAAEAVAQAPADGYTLLSFGNALWLAPFLQKNVPYDPVKDFAPITLAVTAPNILVVHPAVPAQSVKDLIALARAKPGTLNYGGGNTGSSAHLAAILFTSMAGVKMVGIPYRGGAQSIAALIAGEVQLMFPNATSVSPHIKSGRLKALAVTSAQPTPLVPGLPTVAATGLPGYESAAMHGIFAPAKTPAAIISRLNREILQALSRADVKEKFFTAGTTIVGSTPPQLAAAVKAEMASLGKVIKDAGIRAE